MSTDEHRALLKDEIARLEEKNTKILELLERAHDAEKRELESDRNQLQQQLDEYRRRAENPEQSLREMQTRIAELEKLLEHSTIEIGENRLKSAHDSMSRGDFSEANQIFAQVQEHEQRAVERYAEAAFGQGLIAEQEVRWNDAAEHYERAARLSPTYIALDKAGDFLLRIGKFREASSVGDQLLKLSKREFGPRSLEAAGALHARSLHHLKLGIFDRAEEYVREAIEIQEADEGYDKAKLAASIGVLAQLHQILEQKPDAERLYTRAIDMLNENDDNYAAAIGSLADLLRETNRNAEAETLYRRALGISKVKLGETHPEFAAYLNNLAMVLQKMDQLEEAELLFRQAIEIGKATIGETHPDYAIRLNNLAGLLKQMDRLEEARPLLAQSVEIKRAALGIEHVEYAKGIWWQADFARADADYPEAKTHFSDALAGFKQAVGAEHPRTVTLAGQFASLLRKHFPDDPALPKLEATFGPDIGR